MRGRKAECADNGFAKTIVVAKPFFHHHKNIPVAFRAEFRGSDDLDVHGWLSRSISRKNSRMWPQISCGESSCRKCEPVTHNGPLAWGSNFLKRSAQPAGNTISSLPQTIKAGIFVCPRDFSSQRMVAAERSSWPRGISRGKTRVSRRLS